MYEIESFIESEELNSKDIDNLIEKISILKN